MASDNSTWALKAWFFGIPIECRGQIYQMVFSGVRLDLDNITVAQVNQEHGGLYDHKLRPTAHKLRLINAFKNQKTAIIFTCHQILDEAMEFLVRAATLDIKSVIRRQDPTAILPSWFLGLIPTLQVDVSAFVHVSRKRMRALKNMVIVKTAEGADNSSTGHHIMTCESCGGKNARRFVDEVMDGSLSWHWMKNQIIHLSKEEGWKPVLSTRLEYTLDPSNHYLEVLVDMESYQATQNHGVWDGKLLDLDDWLTCFEHYVDDTYG